MNPSLLYADSPYYTGDQMKQYYNLNNQARAKELLKQAGYKERGGASSRGRGAQGRRAPAGGRRAG